MASDESKKLRIAVIDYDKCQPAKCNYLCIRVCPVNRTDKECIIEDPETKKPLIAEELCTGCGICVHKCPFNAISIVNLSSELDLPLHQYGQNTFRLYHSPTPKKNAVVGLIGKNGIGKTTALKILAGHIIPNLGDFENEKPSYKEIVKYFRGNELQNFFEKLEKGKITLAYKLQNVDEINEKFKGTVKKLLETFDEKNQINEISEKLEISKIMNHNISKISGGELQRVAIAATMLRKANIYFFDEPSSYLDVRQRLRVAKLIREISENSSVIVVEHDLAVLDYLSDYINILYGVPGVYGVCSASKSVKNGINEFLEGYLKDENVKFRSKELKFAVNPPTHSEEKVAFLEYPAIEKKYKSFSLKTEPGTLMQGEVLGILGPNAIGKTTFVKILAGVEKPDNTKLNFKFKIAYKPQYLKPEENTTVSDLFTDEIDMELFNSEIERRLDVKKLFDSQLTELSGGELQRVSVALTLSRNSDLILLDEPSAFIDIEDRLHIADAIKAVANIKNKVILVVDHDILFQDYVSDRLIIFEGTPSQNGKANAPVEMHEGMNAFLKDMDITFRRDPETGRPRANKKDSVKDREQKQRGEYYYTV